MKIGAVIIPASTLLQPADLEDRISRGEVRHVIAEPRQTIKFYGIPGDWTRIIAGRAGTSSGALDDTGQWHLYSEAESARSSSRPTGSPGRTTHCCSTSPRGRPPSRSWSATPRSATRSKSPVHDVLDRHPARRRAPEHLLPRVGQTRLVELLLRPVERIGHDPDPQPVQVQRPRAAERPSATAASPPSARRPPCGGCSSKPICPPPTSPCCASASRFYEPLNPEVIEQVRKAWGITVRDGFGQTETTAQVGNPPGQPLKPGSMGRPLPGYPVVLVDPVTGTPGRDGEICLDLSRRPLGLMTGYQDDAERDAEAMRGGYYHTGDAGSGRRRLHHLRGLHRRRLQVLGLPHLAVRARIGPDRARRRRRSRGRPLPGPAAARRAQGVRAARRRCLAGPGSWRGTSWPLSASGSPASGSRRVEFGDLPKTISGKIRRVELRAQEDGPRDGRGVSEFWEEDFTW